MANNARFTAILPEYALEHVQAMMVGCGGIGSYTALLLAKMGIPVITLVDHDVVEEANVGTQLYELSDIGLPKVRALSTTLLASGNPAVNQIHSKFSKDVLEAYLYSPRRLIIMALDSIEARRGVYKAVSSMALKYLTTVDTLIIDPRMTLESLEINAIRFTKDFKIVRGAYVTRLIDKSEVYEEQPCGAKAIPGTGMFAASLIMSVVLRWLRHQPIPHLMFGNLECNAEGNSAPFISSYYPENVVKYDEARTNEDHLLKSGTWDVTP